MTRIVGIDPGVQPTLALRDTANGKIEFYEDTAVEVKRGRRTHTEPRPALITAILTQWRPDIVIIEEVQVMSPAQGRARGLSSGLAGSAQFMRSRGILEGVCAGLGLMYELVPPQRWQRDLQCRPGHNEARAKALQMFPLLAPELQRKKDHNRAAALLLAIWVERFLLPNHPLLV